MASTDKCNVAKGDSGDVKTLVSTAYAVSNKQSNKHFRRYLL